MPTIRRLRSPAVVAVLVTAVLGAACASNGDDEALDVPRSPTPTSGRERPAETRRSADCGPRSRSVPASGPSAEATVLQARGPRVEGVVYPRPDYDGDPWSQWGQGIVLPDGRFVSAIGDHLGADGNSYLFAYDPERRELTRFADVLSNVDHTDGSWGYGKIHAPLVEGPCGEVYVSTYWGSRKGLEYSGSYEGDLLLELDPGTLEVEPVGVPVPRHGIPSLAGSAESGLLFGEATDPSAPDGRDRGAFFAYDLERGDVAFRTDDAEHIGFRNILVGPDGTAYVAAADGKLLAWEQGSDTLRALPERLPGGGWLRASTAPGPDGTVYGVTRDPDRFFALHDDGRVTDLGAARDYAASLALHPDGSRFFYVPGAHGEGHEQGTPLVGVDTETGEQTVVAELNPLFERQFGLTVGGSYSVAVDPAGDRVYVGLNGAERGSKETFGEVALAVVHLADAAGRSGNAAGSASTASCYRAPRDGPGGSIAFGDTTETSGLVDPLTGMYGHAVAAGDVNADGWVDLFVGHFSDRPVRVYRERGATGPAPDRLLLGGPEGFRVDASFPETRGRTSGAAFADLDGDADLDLVIARSVKRGNEAASTPSAVLRNAGGRFEPATELDDRVSGRSIGVFDYDGDGRLDLLLVEDRFAGGSSALFRNTGDFEFTDVTRDVALPNDLDGFGVAVSDLDGDARPDLFVAGSNRLFVNVDGERFREIESEEFAWKTYGEEDDPAGVAAGDVNGDGRVDLVVGQHFNSTIEDGRRVPVRLYLNTGGEPGRPRFRDVTEDAGLVGLPTKAPHVEIVDVDADGRPDILTTASADGGERPAVFRGQGVEGDVPRFAAPDGLGDSQYWVTGATADFDRDGRLDVFAVDYEPARPSRLFANDADTAHWLTVSIGGAGTGVGARVEVFRAGALGEPGALLGARDVVASTGFGGGAVPQAHFGLGDASRVDVRIRPPEGEIVALSGIAADQVVQVGGDAACGG